MAVNTAAQQVLVQAGFNTMLGQVLEDLEVRLVAILAGASGLYPAFCPQLSNAAHALSRLMKALSR